MTTWIRIQEMYKVNNSDKIEKYWVEILANPELLEELISVLNYKDDYVRSAGVVLFDFKTLKILHSKKKVLSEMFKDYKLVSYNLYPETILKLAKWWNWIVKDERQKLEEIIRWKNKEWIITNIEIVENGMNSEDILLNKDKIEIVKRFSKELSTLFLIDDMSLQILELDEHNHSISNDSSKFFINRLQEYLETETVWWIKIDLKIVKMIMNNPEYIIDIIWGILKNKELLRWKYIIFEWVENEEIYNILIDYLNHYDIINNEDEDKYNIHILFQGYYFSKPKCIEL